MKPYEALCSKRNRELADCASQSDDCTTCIFWEEYKHLPDEHVLHSNEDHFNQRFQRGWRAG